MTFKIIRRAFIIFVFVFIMAVFTFNHDQMEKSKYSNIDGYDYEKITLNQNEKFKNEDFKQLITIADNYDVILMRQVYDSDNDQKTFYYSKNNIEETLKLLNIDYKTSDKNFTTSSFASSYNEKSKWKIKDLLNNDRVEIRSLSDLFNSDHFIYSEYRVYYKDLTDFDSFILESKKIFNDSINILNDDMYGVNLSSNNSLNTLLPIIVSLILMLFYLVLEIFNIYNFSKKIGVMKLLGLSYVHIFIRLIKADVIFYGLLTFILLTIYHLFISGVSIALTFQLLILYLLLCMIFLVLSMISLAVIYVNKSMIDILKNKSIVSQLLKVCSVYKILVTALALIQLMITFNSMASYIEKINTLNTIKEIGNWAFFAYVGEENNQYDFNDRSNLNQFYKLLGDSDIDYLYEDFSQYDITDPSDIDRTNEAIENGSYIPFATVDYNYLKNNNIKIYDKNNNPIELTKEDHEYFIFPEEFTEYYQSFVDFYKTLYTDDEHKDKIATDYDLYTYASDEIKMYHLDSENSNTFQSSLILTKPIIRITYDDFPINYLDNMYGLNLTGTQYTTGLKFKITNNKEEVMQSLDKILKKANLDQIFKFSNFATSTDLMSDELASYKNEVITYSLAFFIAISVYFIITVEINYLLLEKRKKETSVKLLLGFKYMKAFQKNYIFDLFTVVIPFAGILLYTVFINSELDLNLNFLFAACIILLFENIVFFCTSQKITLNNATSYLKGDK